jgi:hypothetical protein
MATTDHDRVIKVEDPQIGGLDRFFKITERGSSVRTEIIAGLATWLTMAYILFVNPSILGSVKDSAGTTLPFPAVLTVTALVAGVMTLAMGIYANYPFAIAAGLGLNAFVTFTLVATLGLTWPQAMGVIVIEGAVITLLVLTGFREAVLNAIPMDLKRAIGIGIGLFLAIIGLVVADSFEEARDAAALVKMQYVVEAPVASWEDGAEHSFPPDSVGGEKATTTILAAGIQSIDQAITNSPWTVDVTYTEPIYHHNPMEPHATTAVWHGDRLTMYDTTQGVVAHRLDVAARTPRPRIRQPRDGSLLSGCARAGRSAWRYRRLAARRRRAVRLRRAARRGR